MLELASFFAWLTGLVSGHWWTYALVFGVTLLDADVPLVPSETVIITAGIAASDGSLRIWLIVVSAWAGGVVGDNLSYLLGSKVGEPAYRRLFGGERARARYAWAHRTLDEYGGSIVPAARFVPGGRTAVTFAAGAVGMRWLRFFAADLAASLVWASYAALLGFLGGDAFTASSWRSYALAFGVAGAILLGGAAWWRLRARREASTPREGRRGR